jgi:hypothetical protein
MSIRIGSADYNQDTGPYPEIKKFDSLAYSIVGSAVYTTVSGQATAWNYSLVVSASASALGGGISAGGLDSLRSSFSIPSAVTIVTDEAVTATAFFRTLKIKTRLNPTYYVVDVGLTKAV